MTVVGVDSYKAGWVAVAIDEGGYVGSFLAPNIEAVEAEGVRRWGVQTIVVDIPIGIPDAGPRQADVEARRFIKPRGSSVFPTPVRVALESSTYAEARVASVAASGKSLSAQAFAIAPRVLDVDEHLANARARILEGHPEVSFRAMAGHGIVEPKKSFDGARLRMELLDAEGITIPRGERDALKPAALDDVLDAVAMAWTARRVERGDAQSLPATPEVFSDGVAASIHY